MKHLLKLGGLTPEEITHILDVADEYKRLHRDGIDPKDLQGKAVALIFAKNSTRTRASLEVGIYQMGGLGTYLSANDLQTARGEPVQDTARVLGRYYDAIVCRTYKQTTLDALAKYSGIPVISGMTDYAHPLQVLTDLMTVRERKGTLAGLKAGFVGDGYNMANSVIAGCLAVGMTVTIACPKGYRPAADVLMLAKQYGYKFTLTNDPDEAARDADVLFTDVWVSMGMEREAEQRRRDFTGFTLDAARMALAKPDCMVQHPLPANRGEEIAPDVLEAHADEIFDEAENRIYVEKAVLAVLLALCILNAAALNRRTNRWMDQADRIAQLAAQQRWDMAREAMDDLSADWESAQDFLHVVIHHETLDAAQVTLTRCRTLCRLRQGDDLLPELAQLRQQLQQLDELERLSLRNIL